LDARVVVVAVGVDGEFAQEFAGGGVDDLTFIGEAGLEWPRACDQRVC